MNNTNSELKEMLHKIQESSKTIDFDNHIKTHDFNTECAKAYAEHLKEAFTKPNQTADVTIDEIGGISKFTLSVKTELH